MKSTNREDIRCAILPSSCYFPLGRKFPSALSIYVHPLAREPILHPYKARGKSAEQNVGYITQKNNKNLKHQLSAGVDCHNINKQVLRQ
jgi:hypothetical protein